MDRQDAPSVANDPETMGILAEMAIAKHWQTKDLADLSVFFSRVSDAVIGAAVDEAWVEKQLEKVEELPRGLE